MIRSLAHYFIAAAIFLLVSPHSAPAQDSPQARLGQLMSAHELRSTGIARLTASERAALEGWLARYTATVTAVIQGVERTGSQPRIQPTRPAEIHRGVPAEENWFVPDERRAAPDTIRPRAVPNGLRIYRTAGGGTFVMLEDGTMWEIYLPDSPSIATWRNGDFVLVRERPAPIGEFAHMLINAEGRSSASARFAGWVGRAGSGQ